MEEKGWKWERQAKEGFEGAQTKKWRGKRKTKTGEKRWRKSRSDSLAREEEKMVQVEPVK